MPGGLLAAGFRANRIHDSFGALLTKVSRSANLLD
jgi:hypothetical protein